MRFDVVNFFGNIPVDPVDLDLALELIERDFHLIGQHTPIEKENFMQMLRICCKDANYYDGKFYKQKKDMFMGSSLVLILNERVLEYIVDKALTELKLEPDF